MLQELAKEIRRINETNGWSPVAESDWADRHKIPAILALIHSEVSEALEGWRHNDRENVQEELADVLIRTLDLAGGICEDFDAVVAAKLLKNRERAYRHGGKRL